MFRSLSSLLGPAFNSSLLSGLLLALQFEFELLFCLFSKYVSYSARDMASFALIATPGKWRHELERIETEVLPVHCVHYERTHS